MVAYGGSRRRDPAASDERARAALGQHDAAWRTLFSLAATKG